MTHACRFSAFIEPADQVVCRAYIRQFFDAQWDIYTTLSATFESLCEPTFTNWRDVVLSLPSAAMHKMIAEIMPSVDVNYAINRAPSQKLRVLQAFHDQFRLSFQAVHYDQRASFDIALPSYRQEFIDTIEEKVPPYIVLDAVWCLRICLHYV